jgi:hypothetical protein
MTVPEFFQKMIDNHLLDEKRIDACVGRYYIVDEERIDPDPCFTKFCADNSVDSLDGGNIKLFYTVQILLDLFGVDPLAGIGVLDAPFFYEYPKSNDRCNIFQSGKSLCEKPENVSIKRTPSIFIGDLVSPYPKYFHAKYDSISTFGWCDERELAFCTIAQLLGIPGEVYVARYFGMTVLHGKFKLNSGMPQEFTAEIDADLYKYKWQPSDKYLVEDMYKMVSQDAGEIKRVGKMIISPTASARIERQFINYITSKHVAN